MKYPNKLKEFRLKAGYTQKQVANHLKMQCENRLSHWEKGTSVPSIPNGLKLCKLYKTKMEEVYEL